MGRVASSSDIGSLVDLSEESCLTLFLSSQPWMLIARLKKLCEGIKSRGVITEQEINLLNRRLNSQPAGSHDLAHAVDEALRGVG